MTTTDERVVLDNHLHLDVDHGQGLDAVDDFVRSGGTHLIVINKPSWHLGVEADDGTDFQPVFERTLEIVEAASERLPGRAWAVLGVHPGLISRLVDERELSPGAAASIMQGGLDVASEFVERGDAIGLKSGRPHYEVSDTVWSASNDVMCHAFELGADLECAVQLHAEARADFEEVGSWAADVGLPAHKVVKHYASGDLHGVTPSVMSNREWLEEAVEREVPFFMETDFIDDPDRPGAVMGPKTVPRRVDWLAEQGYTDAIRRAHVDTPKLVYGIDTEATLEDG